MPPQTPLLHARFELQRTPVGIAPAGTQTPRLHAPLWQLTLELQTESFASRSVRSRSCRRLPRRPFPTCRGDRSRAIGTPRRSRSCKRSTRTWRSSCTASRFPSSPRCRSRSCRSRSSRRRRRCRPYSGRSARRDDAEVADPALALLVGRAKEAQLPREEGQTLPAVRSTGEQVVFPAALDREGIAEAVPADAHAAPARIADAARAVAARAAAGQRQDRSLADAAGARAEIGAGQTVVAGVAERNRPPQDADAQIADARNGRQRGRLAVVAREIVVAGSAERDARALGQALAEVADSNRRQVGVDRDDRVAGRVAGACRARRLGRAHTVPQIAEAARARAVEAAALALLLRRRRAGAEVAERALTRSVPCARGQRLQARALARRADAAQAVAGDAARRPRGAGAAVARAGVCAARAAGLRAFAVAVAAARSAQLAGAGSRSTLSAVAAGGAGGEHFANAPEGARARRSRRR